MLGRNDIAKITVAALAALSSSMASGQVSFDSFYAIARTGKVTPREQRFASACGIDLSNATVAYGRSIDAEYHWKRVASLGRGRNEAEMDMFGAAKMWSLNGKPRMIDAWMLVMDVGVEVDNFFCLDEARQVVSQESLNTSTPVDGSNGGWLYLQQIDFLTNGRKVIRHKTFLDRSGHEIPPPKLGPEDMDDASSVLSPLLARDLVRQLTK